MLMQRLPFQGNHDGYRDHLCVRDRIDEALCAAYERGVTDARTVTE
jgi:hypothetical protein